MKREVSFYSHTVSLIDSLWELELLLGTFYASLLMARKHAVNAGNDTEMHVFFGWDRRG